MASTLPKPFLSEVDETSLTISWPQLTTPPNASLIIQYKLPQEEWSDAKIMSVELEENKIKAQVEDLVPGTPYFVRLCVCEVNEPSNLIEIGPETVFDTAPVNCTPKQKSCVIS